MNSEKPMPSSKDGVGFVYGGCREMKKFIKEMKVGIFFLCFSIFYYICSSKINTFSPFGHKTLDSRSMPQMLAVLMAGLSIVLIVISYRKARITARCVQEKTEEEEPVEKISFRGKQLSKLTVRLVACCLLIALYALLYRPLGFVLSSILFLFFLTVLLAPNEKRTLKMHTFYFGFSVAFTLLVYFLFTRVLSMMLPRGILG